MSHARIYDAQRRLGISPTGIEDEALTLALRRFQMEHRLLVTGVLDDKTYDLLWTTRVLGEA